MGFGDEIPHSKPRTYLLPCVSVFLGPFQGAGPTAAGTGDEGQDGVRATVASLLELPAVERLVAGNEGRRQWLEKAAVQAVGMAERVRQHRYVDVGVGVAWAFGATGKWSPRQLVPPIDLILTTRPTHVPAATCCRSTSG